jgi:SPP1 gp7 family putative phage head morphogenesis protein
MADRIQTIAEYSAGIDKWLTRNEIRTREGLIASDEGDNFFGNPMLMPVDKVPTEKKISKPSKKSKIEDTVNKFIAKLPNMGKKTMSDETKKTYIDMWKKGIETSKTAFGKKLIKYFEKQKKEVIANLNSEMKGLNAKEYKLKALSDVLFNETNAVKTGISLITPFIQDWIKRSGDNASDLTDQDFNDKTDNISKFTNDRAKYFADTINQSTADDLMATLKEGTTNGETLEELSKRIADVYDIAEGSRADMIARTEVSASSNFGALEAYTQAGVEQIQWVVVNPEDEDCLANDGQIVSIGDEFNSGDEQPPVHPNCVCTTIPIF